MLFLSNCRKFLAVLWQVLFFLVVIKICFSGFFSCDLRRSVAEIFSKAPYFNETTPLNSKFWPEIPLLWKAKTFLLLASVRPELD